MLPQPNPSQPFAIVCRLPATSAADVAAIEAESNQPPWSEALFEREFKNDYAAIFGVRTAGELVGFLVCHIVLDEAHIVNFGVRKSFRRMGLGKALISEVLLDLKASAVRWVTLEVRRGNKPALELYRSLGFYEAGVRPSYYTDNGEDALLMRASLHAVNNQANTEPDRSIETSRECFHIKKHSKDGALSVMPAAEGASPSEKPLAMQELTAYGTRPILLDKEVA